MRGFARLGIVPDAALASPYLRAQQTARIALEELGIADLDLHTTDALVPGADPGQAVEALREIGGEQMLCVGHAPSLDLLLAHLVGADGPVTQLKKAGLATVDLGGSRAGYGAGRLYAVYPPAALRRLA